MGGAHRLLRSGRAALLLTLTLALAVHAQLYRWTDEKGETHVGQGVDSVPERYRSRARAVGSVDPPPAPSGPAAATVQLLLDTGATRTTISPVALIGLGVTYRDAPKVGIRGVTGSASAYLVSLESVEVGGARVGPLRVLSHDAQMGGGAEGLLGRDFLNHFRVTIDNARGVVELAPK